jgi:hypothetical protein
MVANPHIQPWGRSPALIDAGFAIVSVIYLVTLVVHARRRQRAGADAVRAHLVSEPTYATQRSG